MTIRISQFAGGMVLAFLVLVSAQGVQASPITFFDHQIQVVDGADTGDVVGLDLIGMTPLGGAFSYSLGGGSFVALPLTSAGHLSFGALSGLGDDAVLDFALTIGGTTWLASDGSVAQVLFQGDVSVGWNTVMISWTGQSASLTLGTAPNGDYLKAVPLGGDQTTVPLPQSVLLLGSGLAAVSALRRRGRGPE